jgi:membrane complex biogenesis BtpA family protein
MVHLQALPGTPNSRHTLDEVTKTAVSEAKTLKDVGFDALIIENMHDRPYINPPHPPHTTSAMTRVAVAVREAVGGMAMGIQVLSRGEHEALAIGLACGAAFIRVENFVFAHVADEGLMPSAAAGPLLRYRRALGADHIAVFADIKKKHASHALTADVSLTEAAEAAEFFGAGGVIVTGTSTGKPCSQTDLAEVRSATDLPVLVGSGVTPDQVKALLQHADGLIIGSALKKDGLWSNPLDPARCEAMIAAR